LSGALVHQLLERGHLGRAHAEHALVERLARGGQLAPQVEELVLDAAQDLVEPTVLLAALELRRVEGAREADDRVQLVDGAVGLDPRRVLGHAAPAHEGGLAAVAGARVDTVDADGHDGSSRAEASTGARL